MVVDSPGVATAVAHQPVNLIAEFLVLAIGQRMAIRLLQIELHRPDQSASTHRCGDFRHLGAEIPIEPLLPMNLCLLRNAIQKLWFSRRSQIATARDDNS